MERLLVGLLLAAGACSVAWAEPPGSPNYDPTWMPVTTTMPGSPSSRTARDMSRVQGDARPGVAVPQISIPMKPVDGAKPYNQMRSQPTAGGIDDGAAACRAKRTKEDREACERALNDGH